MQTADWLLLVDDDCLDVAIMQRMLRQLRIPHELVQKTPGETALEYLRGRSENGSRSRSAGKRIL